MLASSNDVLNFVLSVCLVSLTFFLCTAIYYFIASVQKIYRVVNRIETGVAKAEEILDLAKDKLKNSGAYFMLLGELAKKAMAFAQDKKAKKSTSKKK